MEENNKNVVIEMKREVEKMIPTSSYNFDENQDIEKNDAATTTEEVVPAQATKVKALELFNLNEQIHDLKDMKQNIINEQLKLSDDDTVQKHLDEALESYTVEQLKSLTEEEINAIYIMNGEPVKLALDIPDPARALDLKKDFLIYKKESANAIKELDSTLEKFENDMKEHEEEFNTLIAEYGDLNAYIRQSLEEDYEQAETDERKAKIKVMMNAFDDATSLTRLYEHYSQLNTANTLKDYRFRAESIYKNYVKVTSKLGLRTDITAFENLELKYLPEKYHAYPNLFLFAVIKYMAYKKDTVNKASDGLFLSQFLVNVKALFVDRFADADQKEAFLLNIQKVLDLFI